VPFSEVTTVKNLTRDFAYHVINLGVTYRADPDRAMAIMREVAAEVAEDPEFKPFVLAPIEVFGVDKFSETGGVVIQARIKTLPTKQWTVGREFNRRIKKAFDEAGIEMPFAFQQAYLGLPPPDAARQEKEKEAKDSERRRIVKAR
jgi:small conductance mechanosensitive channel